MTALREALAVSAKDLRIQLRGRFAVATVLPFAATVLIAFGLSLGPGRTLLQQTAPGLLWMAVLFASILSFRQAYRSEGEDDALEGLLLSPASRAAIFVGKGAAVTVELLALEVAVVLLVVGLFDVSLGTAPLVVAGAFFLGTVGLAAVGSMFGILAEARRPREAVFPLLVLPLATPVLVAGARATAAGRRRRDGRGLLVAGAAAGLRPGVRGHRDAGVWVSPGGLSAPSHRSDGIGALVSQAERLMGRMVARRGERILGWLAALAMATTAVMSLAVAPPDAEQGQVQRLMYVHVPTAWLAYLAFAVVFVASIAYLRTKRTRWDRMAAASAEIGVLFTALTILLGSLWGKPVWGTWWTWDPRLTTTAILLLIYLGYLAVRRLTESPPRRARWAAVVGIVGFVDVPIVHLSVVWWRSLHQGATVARLGGPTIAPVMLAALLTAVAAFTIVYLYLMVLRLRVGRLEDRVVAEALSPRVGEAAQALLEGEPAPSPGGGG